MPDADLSSSATTSRLSPPRAPSRSRARAWTVTVLVALLMAINFGEKSVLGLAAGPIMKDLHLDTARYGMLASSFYLLFSVSAIVVGFVSNRARTSRILGVLAVLWSLSALPVLLAGSLPALLASRVVLGAAEGPAAPVAVHALHKWFPEGRRGLPTALAQVGGSLGTVLAAPLLSWFIVHDGWRSAWLVLAVTCLAWAVTWSLAGREGPLGRDGRSQRAAGPEDVIAGGGYRQVLLGGTWLGIVACGFSVYWVIAAGLTWIPTYLTQVAGYDQATAGRLVALPPAAGVIALLAVPWLSDRWKRAGATSRRARGIFAGAIALTSALCMLALSVAPAGAPRLIALTLAFGLPSAAIPLIFLVNAEISPVRLRGATSGILIGLLTLGGVLAPTVLGHQLDAAATLAAGYRHGFLLSAALLILGGLTAVAAVNPERHARRAAITGGLSRDRFARGPRRTAQESELR